MSERRVFLAVAALCAVFLIGTAGAMLLYPGSVEPGYSGDGYSFLHHFFSDLGTTRTSSDRANTASMVLFAASLVGIAVALPVFFIAFAPLLLRTSSATKPLVVAGSAAAVVAGLGFIGIAIVPWNLHLDLHFTFVMWTFRAVPVAMILYGVCAWREPALPRRFVWCFALVAAVLVGYALLLQLGPRTDTADGRAVQVVGQKLVVYTAVLSLMALALQATRLPGAPRDRAGSDRSDESSGERAAGQ